LSAPTGALLLRIGHSQAGRLRSLHAAEWHFDRRKRAV